MSSVPQVTSTQQVNDTQIILLSDSDSNQSSVYYTPPSPTSTMTSSTSGSTDESAKSIQMSDTSLAVASGSANISIREYIYFLPHPLPKNIPTPYSLDVEKKNPLNLPIKKFEPTSTLVLTSPNRTFVDLRFYKPISPAESGLPNAGERMRLEWGFAGTSNSTPCADPYVLPGAKPFKDVSYSTWTHWLDSRFPVGSKDIPVDKGHMYPLSPTHTLEVGDMYHPDIGEHKGHEEMWADADILATSSPMNPKGQGKKHCVVLRLHDDANCVRGVIVRVGQHIQGIVMKGTYSTVERWEWKGEEEGWKRTARIGDHLLPCLVTTKIEVLKVHGKVRYHDYEWAVEEAWEWE